jgi:crotonobetainyl-CoA:carnitine CoA-transferase CaiB-like acyl-CoA transferase
VTADPGLASPYAGAFPSAPPADGPESPALLGLRVLDLSRVLSGPFATMVLADLGATVVKIEDPVRGDDTRHWAPPHQGPEASYFLSVNRSKRSVAIDLKHPEGRDLAMRLAEMADVLVENFRPGVAARLGLGYEDVSAQNPGIVYASISGYGQTGPMAGRPGYDAIAQALSGMMSITGEPDGRPVRPGVATADIGAGMWAVIGILAALHVRRSSGRGQWVDVSLLDGQVSWLTYVASGYRATGETPPRYGSAHPTIVPYQAFKTRRGDLMVAVGNDAMWRRFAEAVGLGHLADDPRFSTNPERVRNRDELLAAVGEALLSDDAASWERTLTDAGVPAARVHTVEEALRHPQVVARGLEVTTPHPTAGVVRTLATPVRMSRTGRAPAAAPPTLGQHTDEVLKGLGLDDEGITRLRREGVVA